MYDKINIIKYCYLFVDFITITLNTINYIRANILIFKSIPPKKQQNKFPADYNCDTNAYRT